jgi:hypothetical protein
MGSMAKDAIHISDKEAARNFSFYGNLDNQPPQGFSGSDYGTSSGISYSFGNR